MNKQEQKALKTIKKFAKSLPKFSDGRIDYSKSNVAPVVIVFVKHKDKILLLKRSDKVYAYCGKWSTIAGYLDELKPICEKVLEELKEEIGIKRNALLSVDIGKPYKFTDTNINKIWFRYPVIVKLKTKPKIELDYEHTDYKWIKPEELKNFDVVPKLEKSLENVLIISNTRDSKIASDQFNISKKVLT